MTATDAPAPAPATKNSFQRIAGVLFAPVETFADIVRRPDFVVPLLFLLVMGYATTILTMRHFDFDAALAQQAEQVRKQNPNVSDADLERMGRFGRVVAQAILYVTPVLALAWYAVMALILFGAFRLMGGEGTYKQSLSATLYAWMPMVLLSIVMTIVLMARGGLVDPAAMATVVKSNPAFLVDLKEHPVLFSLLSSLDVFTIWMVALLVIAFSMISKFSRAKTAAIIIALWVVQIVIKIGFTALGTLGTKA